MAAEFDPKHDRASAARPDSLGRLDVGGKMDMMALHRAQALLHDGREKAVDRPVIKGLRRPGRRPAQVDFHGMTLPGPDGGAVGGIFESLLVAPPDHVGQALCVAVDPAARQRRQDRFGRSPSGFVQNQPSRLRPVAEPV